MIGMRNILVHDYLEINHNTIYNVLQNHLKDIFALNIYHIGEIRSAEWNLNKAFSDSITKLEYKLDNFEKTNRKRWQHFNRNFGDEYLPESVRALDDPLGSAARARPGIQESPSPDEAYYRAYDAVFGDSREIVHQKVVDEIKAYAAVTPASVVDLGCGRGRFIALLSEQGFRPIGVDTNQVLVADLQQQGFEVHAQDALEYLESAPDNSLGGVTALHLVEHFEHKQILALLALAHQKLAPGGFIYLETPNPLCPDSLGRFYADPTHQRPIQPFQLSFLLEFSQFGRIKALFLEPMSSRGAFSDERWMTLYQNYGILATKEKDI